MEGFERLPGESQADFRKRYNAETMRRRRAAARAKIAEETGQPYKRKGRGVAKRPPANAGVSDKEWYASRQQEGESDEDYKKRNQRERQARYRDRHPEVTEAYLEKRKQDRAKHRELYGIRRRGKGKGPLKNSFLTQEEWESLQQRVDETIEEHEKRYFRYIVAKYRDRHYDRLKVERLAHYQEHRVEFIEKQRIWRENNPERARANWRRYFEKNREKQLAALKQWTIDNPTKYAEAKAAWYQANAARRNFYSSKYRAQKGKATPNWVRPEEFIAIYEEAQLTSYNDGILYAVDHIIAIQGKTEEGYEVRGLHVPWNLQILPMSENSRKNNRCQQADAVDDSAEAYN